MTTAKQILKEAQTDIDSAIGIVNQAMNVVGTLAANGQADSALTEFFLRVASEFIDAMSQTASTAVQEIKREEVKKELAIIRGDLATLKRKMSMGQ
jgi:hypothetical protein